MRLWSLMGCLTAMVQGAQITRFDGGRLDLQLQGNLSPYGLSSGTGARGAMEGISSLYPTSGSLFGNPAALGRLDRLSAQTDFFLPGLGLGLGSERMRLLQGDLRQPIHELLSEPGNRVHNPEYPEVSLDLYQASNFNDLSAAYRWKNLFHGRDLVFAAGYQQPLYGQAEFSAEDFLFGMGAPDKAGGPADSIKLSLRADASARGELELSNWSLGLAGAPWPFLRLGLAYHLYLADVSGIASAEPAGSVAIDGEDHAFNDDQAGYANHLGGDARASLRGAAHGLRLGAALDLGSHFGVDALVSLAQAMKMDGNIRATYHTYPAVRFEPDVGFDPGRVNSQQPALTRRNGIRIDQTRLSLPWELGLSAHTRWEGFRLNLDYVYYLRGLSVGYRFMEEMVAIDSATNAVLSASAGGDSVETMALSGQFVLRAGHQLALGLEVRQVFLHFGGVFYDLGDENLPEEAAGYRPDWLPFIPIFNLGYYFPVGPKLTATVSLFAFPVALFKTTVELKL